VTTQLRFPTELDPGRGKKEGEDGRGEEGEKGEGAKEAIPPPNENVAKRSNLQDPP